MNIVQPIVRPIVQGIAIGLGGSGGGFDPLVFHALDDVAGSFVNDVIKGVGNLTEACTSTRYLPDDSGVWQSFGSGVAGKVYAGGKWWLYGAKASTNSQIHSKDLTNVEWAASNMTVVFTADGMTGTANDASDLTATAGNATVIANAITDASDDQLTRWFIKRKTGTGVIEITVDGGSTWQDVTTEVDSTAGFNECLEDQAALTDPQIGIRIVTDTDAVYVGNAEAHLGDLEAAVRQSSPIFTAGATGTINATDLSFDDANHADDQGLWSCEFMPMTSSGEIPTGSTDILTTSLGVGGQIYINALNKTRTNDATNTANSATAAMSAGNVYEFVVGYDTVAAKMYAGITTGGRGSDVVYDGSYSTSAGKIQLLNNYPATALMRDVRRYDLSLAPGKIRADQLLS